MDQNRGEPVKIAPKPGSFEDVYPTEINVPGLPFMITNPYERIDRDHYPLRQKTAPITRSEPKIGRNTPCICGSGKKYKHCCQPNQ